jgi:chemotaxis protein MotB
MIRKNPIPAFLPAAALLAASLAPLTGCAEVQALRVRTDDQQKQIQTLKEENRQFQDAYYRIKETLDTEATKAAQRVELLERELEQARNLRTQKENELNNQLRTRALELEALRTEMDELKALDEATINRLQQVNQSLVAERDASLAKLTQREEQLRKEKDRTEQLTRDVAGLKVDLQASQDSLAGTRKELETARATIKQRDGTLADAAQTQQQADQTIAQLKARATEATTSIDDLKQRNAALDKEIAALKKSIETADGQNEKIQELTKTSQQLEKQVGALKANQASLAADETLKKAMADFSEQKKALDPAAPAAKIDVRLDAAGLHFILPSDVLFKPNAIVLADEAPAMLQAVSKALAGLAGRQVRVEGHTDNQPIQELPFADNWGLGFARADRVREFLSKQGGVAQDRLTALSRAQFQPLGDNATPEGRARNRRVEIVVGAAGAP